MSRFPASTCVSSPGEAAILPFVNASQLLYPQLALFAWLAPRVLQASTHARRTMWRCRCVLHLGVQFIYFETKTKKRLVQLVPEEFGWGINVPSSRFYSNINRCRRLTLWLSFTDAKGLYNEACVHKELFHKLHEENSHTGKTHLPFAEKASYFHWLLSQSCETDTVISSSTLRIGLIDFQMQIDAFNSLSR